MLVVKETLLADMSKAMAGVASGTVQMDGADSLYFNDGYVHSYNSAISATVKLSQNMNVKGIVNAKDLYDCVKKLPSDFELTESESVWELKCGKIKVKIKLLDVSDIEERFKNVTPKDDLWMPIDGKDFNNALSICYIPQNKSQIEGVFCKDRKFISTDQYQMTVYNAENDYPTFYITNSAVAELKKWDNFKAVQLNKSWLMFKSDDDVVFSVKTKFADKYPVDKIKKVIDDTLVGESVVEHRFVPELFDAISRALGFSDQVETFDVVTFVYGKDGLTVKSERNAGAYEETVDAIKVDTDLETMVNARTFIAVKGIYDSFKVVVASEKKQKRYVLKSDKAMSVICCLAK